MCPGKRELSKRFAVDVGCTGAAAAIVEHLEKTEGVFFMEAILAKAF